MDIVLLYVFIGIFCGLCVGYSIILLFELFILVLSEVIKVSVKED